MTSPTRTQSQVFMQGRDFKAEEWAQYIEAPVKHFTTIRDMISMFLTSASGDILIYRYQNNPRRLSAALAVLVVIALQIMKARLTRQRVVWICHNVDRETQPFHPWIQQLRRKALFISAEAVFVMDPAFVSYCDRADAIPISFGRKRGGSTSLQNLRAIDALAQSVDRVILIASQDGGKYKAFERIPEIHARFAELGFTIAFVTAGMAEDRSFSPELEDIVLRIFEPNICERDLAGRVNYIYRENADISVPYSIYAAATAGIPILTRSDNILAEIVERERIGTTMERIETLKNEDYDFDGFLERHHWCSLRDQLMKAKILT